MYTVKSRQQSNISNIIIKKNNLITLFNFTIRYNNETSLILHIDFIEGPPIIITIINKYVNTELMHIVVNKSYNEIINTTFKLIVDDLTFKNKIPKIIHQSYTNKVNSKLFPVISSWKEMNINYEYKYWNDEECYQVIKENFNSSVVDAYNMLYAGAYKSDIFRLCILYLYGGIWTDISSVCEVSLDNIIHNENLIIVKDTKDTQQTYGNIYQAFIICESKSPIIKYILDFTVNRVIKNVDFNNTYSQFNTDTIAVTGPTIFAMALNIFINRGPTTIFKENEIVINDNRITLFQHNPGEIVFNNNKIITTKQPDWHKGRTTLHYDTLFKEGYVYKKKIVDVYNGALNVYQIWIQDEFVSHNMYNAIQSIFIHNPQINYTLLTNDKIMLLLKEDNEFENLLNAYNLIKPYAFKSDLIRLYILYKNGGAYIDIDFICTYEIVSLCNKDLVLCKDINNNSIYNGFIYSKKGNLFLKYCIIECIKNIMNKKRDEGDLSISGPVFMGKCLSLYFNISFPIPDVINENIKILEYKFNLPLPKGGWIDTARNYYVTNGNILHAECRAISGSWVTNNVKFYINDMLDNMDGKLIGNTNFIYEEVEGSGLIYGNNIYFISKYKNYNNERLLMNGNDFGNMYKNNDIYN
jgi:mannosyltransferase OCH1-like enzyme